MANWAIVIGVDQYSEPSWCLKGAVADALAMRAWLLDAAGGNVPPQNLALLLSPRPGDQPPSRFTQAAHAQVVGAIEQVLSRSGGVGERFYFYFAGHGITVRNGVSSPSGILFCDFADFLTTQSLTVKSLFEIFQSTRFAEQYFFIDACRNVPYDAEKRLGEYPNPRAPVPPVSPQFVMYATQPGALALEVSHPGSEAGAFTRSLLEGLRGVGGAKRWDDATGDYVVRWNSLFKHVESSVAALKLHAGSAGGGPLIQEPKQYGERGSLDPELGRFAEATFSEETLDISLDPQGLGPQATLTVGDLGATVLQQGPGVTPLPLRLMLPPRTYGIRSSVPGYRTRQRQFPVDLYAPSSVTIRFEALPPSPSPPPPSPPSAMPAPAPVRSRGRPLGGDASPGGGETSSRAAAAASVELLETQRSSTTASASVSVTVEAADPLASVEVTSSSGAPAGSGRGSVRVRGAPGFYRCRVVSPEGTFIEELVELTGDSAPVQVGEATELSPAMERLLSMTGMEQRNDGTVEPSEAIGRAHFLKLSTLLALAVGAGLEQNDGFGYKLRKLGIPTPPPGPCWHFVLGDERLDPRSFAGGQVRFLPLNGEPIGPPVQLVPHPHLPGIAFATHFAAPGGYLAEVALPGQSPWFLPTGILDDRAAVFVMTRERDDSLELHHYQLANGAPALQPVPDWKRRDPQFSAAAFPAIRRIEAMQRSAAHGRVTPTLPDVEVLLHDKWADPVAGCLGGYLALRMGRERELDMATQNLVNYFPGLSDSHVLRGAYLQATGRTPEAAFAFERALDSGLPSYRDGLTLLDAALSSSSSHHPRRALLADFTRLATTGELWSLSSQLPSPLLP